MGASCWSSYFGGGIVTPFGVATPVPPFLEYLSLPTHSTQIFVSHRLSPRTRVSAKSRILAVYPLSDSKAAINRIASATIGPGQRFAVTTHEARSCVMAWDNTITVRWILGHQEVGGNKMADLWPVGQDKGGGQRPRGGQRLPVGDEPVAYDNKSDGDRIAGPTPAT